MGRESEDSNLCFRWRMILGPEAETGQGSVLTPEDLERDKLLENLLGNKGAAAVRKTNIANCMEGIEKFFRGSVAEYLKREAIEHAEISSILEEPQLLSKVEPNIDLVLNLLSSRHLIDENNKMQVRQYIKRYIDLLQSQYFSKINNEISGVLRGRKKTSRPHWADIEWPATIKKNLKHYQKDFQTILPVNLVGSRRVSSRPHCLYLLIDQSYSMAKSAIHAGILSALLSSLPYLNTRVFVFDTEFAELTEWMQDPVDVLYGIQLGGGTHIAPLLEFIENEIVESDRSFVLLISDLYEGYSESRTFDAMRRMQSKGVSLGVFLAMDEGGRMDYNRGLAKRLLDQSISVAHARLEDLKQKLTLFFQRKNFFI